MVKFLDLQAVTAKYAEEIHEAVQRVVDSGWYLQGEDNSKRIMLLISGRDTR